MGEFVGMGKKNNTSQEDKKVNEEERKEIDDEYQNLKNEIVRDQVRAVFSKNPQNLHEAMKQIGFEYFDDNYGDNEEQEERDAVPENLNQEILVSYFKGEAELTDEILEFFLNEKNAENPNFPLFRRYFKQGNKHLKKLLLLGIKKNPTNRGLLSDLGFFNIFQPVLKELIVSYSTACKLEEDLEAFRVLAEDFYINTEQQGFDAFPALTQIFDESTRKRKVIDQLIEEYFSINTLENKEIM
jgi:hypothetical protein